MENPAKNSGQFYLSSENTVTFLKTQAKLTVVLGGWFRFNLFYFLGQDAGDRKTFPIPENR
jgi:hypothetical protein